MNRHWPLGRSYLASLSPPPAVWWRCPWRDPSGCASSGGSHTCANNKIRLRFGRHVSGLYSKISIIRYRYLAKIVWEIHPLCQFPSIILIGLHYTCVNYIKHVLYLLQIEYYNYFNGFRITLLKKIQLIYAENKWHRLNFMISEEGLKLLLIISPWHE